MECLSQSDLLEEYKIGALAFVPEHEIDRVWRYLKPLLDPTDMIMSFSIYFEATWIGTSSTRPIL